jgi:hypothetical protein
MATRADIIAALGPLDDIAVPEVVEMGVTPEELAEAEAWLANDEALINLGRSMPAGRLGRLVEIAAEFDHEEEDSNAKPS